jgi:hypothetical protein
MIELSGDPKRDAEIIGFSNRRNQWYSIVQDLKQIVESSTDLAISDPKELAIMEEAQEWFQKINVEKK